MNVVADVDVGADTHTGRVRSTNEDDYLVYCPEDPATRSAVGLLFAVADGMGGATGGGEASRAAIRALAGAFAESDGEGPEARMTRGFAAACERLWHLAREQPRLRDMGTTLTAVNLLGDRIVVGHVGDTRCYVLRGGELRQLTVDHAVRRADHQLTRCIGAGREREEIDVITSTVQPGDVLVLASDGLWDAVDPETLAHVVRGMRPQAAAEELVRLAVEAGGVDNCTAVVVALRGCGDPGRAALVPCRIPGRELVRLPRVTAELPALRRPRWPWVVLALAFVLAGLAAARMLLGAGTWA